MASTPGSGGQYTLIRDKCHRTVKLKHLMSPNRYMVYIPTVSRELPLHMTSSQVSTYRGLGKAQMPVHWDPKQGHVV